MWATGTLPKRQTLRSCQGSKSNSAPGRGGKETQERGTDTAHPLGSQFATSQPSSVGAALVAPTVKNPPAKQETQVRSLGQKDPLEKEMTTHSSTAAWKILWVTIHGVAKSLTGLSDFTFTF